MSSSSTRISSKDAVNSEDTQRAFERLRLDVSFIPGSMNELIIPDWCNSGAQSELLKLHCERYSIDPSSADVYRQLKTRELKEGVKLNPTVEPAVYEIFAELFIDSQRRFLWGVEERRSTPVKDKDHQIFFAPTGANIDHNIGAEGMNLILQRGLKELDLATIQDKLNEGPQKANGNKSNDLYWENINSVVELLASIINIGASESRTKLRMRASSKVREWIMQTLKEGGHDPGSCLGSAPAVCSQLADILGFAPTLVAQDKISEALKRKLPKNLRIFDGSLRLLHTGDIQTSDVNNDHFPVYFSGAKFELPGDPKFKAKDKEYGLNDLKYADLIITGSSGNAWERFGEISKDAANQIVKDYGLAVFSAFQNLSDSEASSRFLNAVNSIHDTGTPVAVLYAQSKHPKVEASVFKTIKELRCVDYLGMNSDEAPHLLHNLSDNILNGNSLNCPKELGHEAKQLFETAGSVHPEWGMVKESPEWMTRAAITLKKVIGIPFLRLRGRAADIIVTDGRLKLDTAKIVENLIASRHLAVLKVGCYPELISKVQDLALVLNPPSGRAIASYYGIADSLKEHYSLSKEESERFIESGRAVVGDIAIITAPAPGMIGYRGKTVSAGDIMDSVFCILSRKELAAARSTNI